MLQPCLRLGLVAWRVHDVGGCLLGMRPQQRKRRATAWLSREIHALRRSPLDPHVLAPIVDLALDSVGSIQLEGQSDSTASGSGTGATSQHVDTLVSHRPGKRRRKSRWGEQSPRMVAADKLSGLISALWQEPDFAHFMHEFW